MSGLHEVRNALRLGVSAMALALAGPVAAAAQDTAPQSAGVTPAKPEGEPATAIQEIVVTAQKRSQNINDVGLAITAATGLQLKQQGVTSVAQLTKIEPSLQFSQTQTGTPVFTLRGVGYFEQSLSATPAVSVYQDEVAFPYPVMSKGVLLDPERVEILKGPQGTLYGQNATGGAVNFVAAKPTSVFVAGVDDSFERFNRNLLSGFISGPLTPTLNARLAGSIEEGGAWQRSETRDDRLGNKDTKIGRLLLDWTPTSNLKASLNLNGWKDRSETQAGQLEGFRFASPQNISTGSPSDPAFYLPAPAGSVAYAGYPAQIKAQLAQPINLSSDRAADWTAGTHPRNDEDFYQAALRLDYTFSPGLGLTLISNYEHFREANQIDEGGTAVPAENTIIRGSVSTFSEELRLHGLAFAGALSWLAGANFEVDKSVENDPITLVSTVSFATVGLGLPPFFNFSAFNTDRTKTYSAFGNVEYRVLPTVTLHGGVRYTQSNQDITGCTISGDAAIATLQNAISGLLASSFGGTSTPGAVGQCGTLGPPPNFNPSLQFNKLHQNNVPWRVGVDWKPAAHTLFYFSVSKGYKAGSSPALGASQYTQLIPVTQESLTAFEVGTKAELFDRTLQFNVSLFHYSYNDKQELGRRLDPVYGAVQALLNIPKSKEDGAEISAAWHPVNGLTLNGAFTYLRSKVTSNFFDYGPYPLGVTDLVNFRGEAFPFTPRYSAQYGVRYDWRLAKDLNAFVGADGSYQSRSTGAFGSQEAVADRAPSLDISSYALVNLTAGVSSANDRWRAEIFGRNVTNRYYYNSVNYISDTVVRLTGLPATYGVRLSYRFGRR